MTRKGRLNEISNHRNDSNDSFGNTRGLSPHRSKKV